MNWFYSGFTLKVCSREYARESIGGKVMKKEYERAELEIMLVAADVVTTSEGGTPWLSTEDEEI